MFQDVLKHLTVPGSVATKSPMRPSYPVAPLLASVLACGALTAACSSETSTPSQPQAEGGTAGNAGSSSADAGLACQEPSQLDLDGIFAIYARLSLTFLSRPGGAVTVCPVDQTSDGTFLALAELRHVPGSTKLDQVRMSVCSLTLPEISAGVGGCDPDTNVVWAGLRFPQVLVDALPLTPMGEATGLLSKPQIGATVDLSRMTFLIGTREKGDAMPGWQSDVEGCGMNDVAPGRGATCDENCVSGCSQLADDDHDQWPGVTVHVCGVTDDDKKQNVPCNAENPSEPGVTIQGRSVLDLQVDPLFSPQVRSSCEMAGSIDTEIRYNVCGADLYLMNTPISVTSAIASLPVYKVNSQQSTFRAVRIDGRHGAPSWDPDFGKLLDTCRRVIERQNEIK